MSTDNIGYYGELTKNVLKLSSNIIKYQPLPIVLYCVSYHMSRVMRKPFFHICENKDADQLCGNREADQRLCFRYIHSTIPLLSKYKFLSLWPSCVVVEPGLCQTWSETPKTGFLTKEAHIFLAVCVDLTEEEDVCYN